MLRRCCCGEARPLVLSLGGSEVCHRCRLRRPSGVRRPCLRSQALTHSCVCVCCVGCAEHGDGKGSGGNSMVLIGVAGAAVLLLLLFFVFGGKK